jgi:hypothetical protein
MRALRPNDEVNQEKEKGKTQGIKIAFGREFELAIKWALVNPSYFVQHVQHLLYHYYPKVQSNSSMHAQLMEDSLHARDQFALGLGHGALHFHPLHPHLNISKCI